MGYGTEEYHSDSSNPAWTYMSEAEHPETDAVDPRRTATPGEAELMAVIDNGATYDMETGELGYKRPEGNRATGGWSSQPTGP